MSFDDLGSSRHGTESVFVLIPKYHKLLVLFFKYLLLSLFKHLNYNLCKFDSNYWHFVDVFYNIVFSTYRNQICVLRCRPGQYVNNNTPHQLQPASLSILQFPSGAYLTDWPRFRFSSHQGQFLIVFGGEDCPRWMSDTLRQRLSVI